MSAVPITPPSPTGLQPSASEPEAKYMRDEPQDLPGKPQHSNVFSDNSNQHNISGDGSPTLSASSTNNTSNTQAAATIAPNVSASNASVPNSVPLAQTRDSYPSSSMNTNPSSSPRSMRDISPVNGSGNAHSDGQVHSNGQSHGNGQSSNNDTGIETINDSSSSAQRSLKPNLLTSKPRSRSSVVPRSNAVLPRSKVRQSSFSADQPNLKPLSTHSPIAMAAAAAVTADKIRKLLVVQGPLPIRHITSHLASTITGFGELSLSKQRRLIIAVLDGPKSEFVKVGWGRWAVDGHGSDRKSSLIGTTGLNLSSGLANSNPNSLSGNGLAAHRQSISKQLPNSKPPLSPSLGPVEDAAVFSDSESSDFDDESEVEGTDDEDWRSLGPAGLRQTSPREQDAIAALVQLRSN